MPVEPQPPVLSFTAATLLSVSQSKKSKQIHCQIQNEPSSSVSDESNVLKIIYLQGFYFHYVK